MRLIPLWNLICTGFVLAVTLSSTPVAARTLAEIKADGTLKVGLTGDYAPYSLRGPDDKITGADVTMAEALAQTLGVALEIVPTTWKTMTSDFEAGRFDIVMGGVSITTERAALGLFSVPVSKDGKRPIVRCADKDRYTSIAAIDQSGVRVDVNPGGANETFAKAHFRRAQIKVYSDNRTIFDDVAAGHADVMVTDGVEVDLQARRHPGVLCPAVVPQAFDSFEKAYWMTRDSSLKEVVDTFVQQHLWAYRKALRD